MPAHEWYLTGDGRVIRDDAAFGAVLRHGPFPSRSEADAARSRLYSASITASQRDAFADTVNAFRAEVRRSLGRRGGVA